MHCAFWEERCKKRGEEKNEVFGSDTFSLFASMALASIALGQHSMS